MFPRLGTKRPGEAGLTAEVKSSAVGLITSKQSGTMNRTALNETPTEKPAAGILQKILETPAPTLPKPTMPQYWPGAKEREWLNKWLKITPHHPALRNLEFEVYQFCKEYAQHPRAGRRLLIHGPNGCGKTHAARAIQNWARRTAMLLPLTRVPNGDEEDTQLATVQFLFWPGVVDGFKPPRNEYGIIDDAVEQSLVIVDDIGADHDPSGIGREKLFFMLERRVERWTVLTTNCPPAEWENKFERRIASRFLRNCHSVDLSGVEDFCAM